SHRRGCNAREIFSTGTVSGGAVEYPPQFIPRHTRFAQTDRGVIKFECAQPRAQRRRVGKIGSDLNTEAIEVVINRVRKRTLPAAASDFDNKRLSGFIAQYTIPIMPAGLGKQLQCLLKVIAQTPGWMCVRLLKHRAKDFRWQLITPGFQQRQLCLTWKSGSGQRSVGKITGNPAEFAIEDLVVDPFKIQCIVKRFADAHILKALLAQIDDPAIHCWRIRMRETLFDDLTGFKARSYVLAAPVTHLGFTERIIITRAQCGYLRIAIFVEFVDDGIEIKTAALHREIPAPVIRITPVDNVASTAGFFNKER